MDKFPGGGQMPSLNGVTVLIPLYQGREWIEETLQSVLCQSLPPQRVIVLDDGSTDGGVAVCQRISRDSKVRVDVYSQPNVGQARTRNRAFEFVDTKYAAFLDADDRWHPEKLKRQVEFMRCRNLEAVTSGYFLWKPGAGLPRDYLSFDWSRESLKAWSMGYGAGPALASTLIIETKLFRAVGGFREDLSIFTDLDFSLRLARRVRINSVPEPLVAYRQHESQIHRNANKLVVEAASFAQINLDDRDADRMKENIAVLAFLRELSSVKVPERLRKLEKESPRQWMQILRFLGQRWLNRHGSRMNLDAAWWPREFSPFDDPRPKASHAKD